MWSEMKLLSRVRLFVTPWTVAYQASPSMGFSRQEYWSGLLFPSPGDLPDPGIKPGFPALQANALSSEPPGKPLYVALTYWFLFTRRGWWHWTSLHMLTCTHIPFLVKCFRLDLVFYSFALLTVLFVFFFLVNSEFFISFGYKSDMWYANMLSQSVAYLSNLLPEFFTEQKFLILVKSTLSIFLLWIMLLVSYLRTLYLAFCHKDIF